MNLPDASRQSHLNWHTFRLPTPPSEFYRCPVTNRLKKTKPYRHDVEDWCMANIKGQWSESRPEGGNVHVFKIKEKADAMMFKLTWSLETVKPSFA